jgi:hypothetical protein
MAVAWASPVSLLQETREIECVFAKAHPKYGRLVIERKDTKIEAFKGKEKIAEFARVKFLDSAILLDGALFQILPNGEAQFTEGKLISFLEKDCEDTGASKTCRADGFKKLFWSPEKLTMDGKGGALRQYGFFANHATYFLSDGLSLLDYGRELNLLVGPARKMNCKYLD